MLQDPYTNDSKWFAPFELARRLLPAIFISIDPGNLVSELKIFPFVLQKIEASVVCSLHTYIHIKYIRLSQHL